MAKIGELLRLMFPSSTFLPLLVRAPHHQAPAQPPRCVHQKEEEEPIQRSLPSSEIIILTAIFHAICLSKNDAQITQRVKLGCVHKDEK